MSDTASGSLLHDLTSEAGDGRRARRDRNRDAVVDALLELYHEGRLDPSSDEIATREFEKVKLQLLNGLTNPGRPFIYVVDANYRNRGELYLLHKFQGIELKQDYAVDSLRNLHKIWARPVHIETVIDDKPAIISFDGSNHSTKEK